MADKVELMNILKEAINCDEIIIEQEEGEGNSEEIDEEYEIIDIIEEIEEIEETEEVQENDQLEEEIQRKETFKSTIKHSSKDEEEYQIVDSTNDQNNGANGRTRSLKSKVEYDVGEDWEDEDVENIERLDTNSSDLVLSHSQIETTNKKYGSTKNKRTFHESQSNVDECTSKRSRLAEDYVVQQENSNDDTELIRTEDNLVYAVLESKKQSVNHSVISADNQHRMEQLEEDTIPIEGTIYYDNDNVNTLYVTQTGEDGEQYRLNDVIADENEQEWDNSQQSIEQPQDEDVIHDQVFLHEDDDGQLYFKDENGTLQPVYLTEDGNYAIAGNSGDEMENQECNMEESQLSKSCDDQDNYIIPDKEVISSVSKQSSLVQSSNAQDVDNEDNTVTISLIISEDEHGQKRTQVIIPTTENLKCDICHKTFKTPFQLLKHNRLKHAREEDITTRNFPCDLCPKRFPDQNSLARHRKTHTGDRPFQCLECQKTFPTAPALRRHLTLHNPQSRPLPCIYCGRRFLEKASLAKHEQSHLAAEQKNHTCDICHKSFSQASELALHKKNHDPDRKFDCEVCGREFNRLNNLQRHMMVHQQQGANEEILSCEVCGITYKFMSSLTRHMVTTHMNPEKMRQQAEEQRRKRENNYRRYLENRKMYETQNPTGYVKRNYQRSIRMSDDNDDEV